jgi:hypothetical protein
MYDLTPKELRSLGSLNPPHKLQRFLDSLPYHHADTAWSPRKVLREGTAHCLEGALLAAAALRVNGFPPLLFDLEATRDTDHVLAIYRYRGHWGAVGQSGYAGLRYREPVYRTLRELAMSYFDSYFNYAGDRSMRAYSTRPLDLTRFDARHWMTSEKSVWFIPEALIHMPHTKAITPAMIKALSRVGERNFAAGMVGNDKYGHRAVEFEKNRWAKRLK